MIIHTVTFTTKHAKGSDEEREFLRAGIALAELPMVHNFQFLKQISDKNDFEYGFSMEFESEIDYQAYNSHPVHVEFVETRWLPEIENFLELDYVKSDKF